MRPRSCGTFSTLRPDWREHAQDIFGRDRVNRLHAQWRSIGFECYFPLRAVFFVSEALALFGHDLVGEFPERRDAPVLFCARRSGRRRCARALRRRSPSRGLQRTDLRDSCESPSLRALPCQRKRRTHFFLPRSARRPISSPPPSPYLPGLAAFLTFRASPACPSRDPQISPRNQHAIVSDDYGRVKSDFWTKNHADSNNLGDNDGRGATRVRRKRVPRSERRHVLVAGIVLARRAAPASPRPAPSVKGRLRERAKTDSPARLHPVEACAHRPLAPASARKGSSSAHGLGESRFLIVVAALEGRAPTPAPGPGA